LHEHLPHALPDKHDRALEVDREHVVDRRIARDGQHALVGDRRIRDAVVDAAESGRHLLDEAADRGRVGGIYAGREEPVGVGRGEGIERRRTRAGERGDRIAAGQQPLGQGEAKAA